MMYLIKKIFKPEIFQGKYKKRNYFEGWYYKIIDSKMENVFAIIPGVSFDKDSRDMHAFIQILDAYKCKTEYLKYDISSFRFNENKFEVEIADNYFSDKEIRLSICNESLQFYGHLTFENTITYPKSITRPGIMGPFTFAPFMECYHGIVNIHHDIFGYVSVLGNEVDFNKGYGYIEKDWGRSFPEAWIWLQSNHFGTDKVSLMFSVAKIPWLGKYFVGYISFIRIKDRMYNFSTYNKSKLTSLNYCDNLLKVVLEDKNYKMEINAKYSESGVLKAPKNGLMKREILESITAVVKVKLKGPKGEVVYEGEGINTGLEVVGDILAYI